MRAPIVVLCVMVAVSACRRGSDDSSSPTSPSGGSSLTGTWSGSASDSSGPGQMTWQVTQSGGSFNGTMTITDTATKLGGRGSVSGTIAGSSLQFTIAVPAGGFDAPYGACTLQASGPGEVSPTSITGAYSGSNSCAGTIASGQLTLNKQ